MIICLYKINLSLYLLTNLWLFVSTFAYCLSITNSRIVYRTCKWYNWHEVTFILYTVSQNTGPFFITYVFLGKNIHVVPSRTKHESVVLCLVEYVQKINLFDSFSYLLVKIALLTIKADDLILSYLPYYSTGVHFSILFAGFGDFFQLSAKKS
jgi:hypothetical protein